MTPEERYAHLVATDPYWALQDARRKAEEAIRTAYKAGDRSTPQLLAIQEVVEGVDDLKTRINEAVSLEEWQVCYDLADTGLYEKAKVVEWRDPLNLMFLTDTRRWCDEAMDWLKDSSTKGNCSESVEQAKEWALGALGYFEKGMF